MERPAEADFDEILKGRFLATTDKEESLAMMKLLTARQEEKNILLRREGDRFSSGVSVDPNVLAISLTFTTCVGCPCTCLSSPSP